MQVSRTLLSLLVFTPTILTHVSSLIRIYLLIFISFLYIYIDMVADIIGAMWFIYRFIAKTLYGEDEDEDDPPKNNCVEEPKLLGLHPNTSEKVSLF